MCITLNDSESFPLVSLFSCFSMNTGLHTVVLRSIGISIGFINTSEYIHETFYMYRNANLRSIAPIFVVTVHTKRQNATPLIRIDDICATITGRVIPTTLSLNVVAIGKYVVTLDG